MVGTLVSLDQLTKFLITEHLDPGQSLAVIAGFFQFTLVHNTGAPFGMLANLPGKYREPFFFLVPGITLVVVLITFYRLRERQLLSVYALSLIVGGALGNIMDRLRLGHVVDFLDFHFRQAAHFPAFNLADTAITVGVGLLFLGLLLEREAREA
jgi:signal peptidase II